MVVEELIRVVVEVDLLEFPSESSQFSCLGQLESLTFFLLLKPGSGLIMSFLLSVGSR